jgi:hypothetical protein
MVPPAVPADPKFAWWSRLRDVDCSWVSTRGESERFLYYDGPTLIRSPVQCTLEGPDERLTIRPTRLKPSDEVFTRIGAEFPHEALLVRVARGKAVARAVAVPVHVEASFLTWPAYPDVDPVERPAAAAFEAMITRAGLNKSEAAGMVASWRRAFFETDGVRLLMLLSPADYEFFCPLKLSPAPTSIARVGVIWTELK